MFFSDHVPCRSDLHQDLIFAEPTALFKINPKSELLVFKFSFYFVEVHIFNFVNALELGIARENEFDWVDLLAHFYDAAAYLTHAAVQGTYNLPHEAFVSFLVIYFILEEVGHLF